MNLYSQMRIPGVDTADSIVGSQINTAICSSKMNRLMVTGRRFVAGLTKLSRT